MYVKMTTKLEKTIDTMVHDSSAMTCWFFINLID